jgi:hypothetical protein
VIRLVLVFFVAVVLGVPGPASAQETASQDRQALKLVQTILLPGVRGRLDHMAVDLEGNRLFVAASDNNTLEVVDLATGKVTKSLGGFRATQDALFLGGDVDKLYVSSLDGHVRVFGGDALRMVQDFKIELGANRLYYDAAHRLIYVGYGGESAGFDAYERLGILRPSRGPGDDQFVADMIAPTPRPGHLAEVSMDGDRILLACDSVTDTIYQFDTLKRELAQSWPARGGGAADLALDRAHHRLFVGTRTPPEMTVYDSLSGKEIQSLPAPEAMDGVQYDDKLRRVYVSGGRWYGTPQASRGWVYVYQQNDPDHYTVVSKVTTRPGSGTSLFVSQSGRLYVASQAIGQQAASILIYDTMR